VYNRLINNMGFQKENIEVGHQSTIETNNFDGFESFFILGSFPKTPPT